MSEDHPEDAATTPSAHCDGEEGCGGAVVAMILGTGERLCAHCGAERLRRMALSSSAPAAEVEPGPA